MGFVLASISDKFVQPSSVNTMECMAAIRALRFAGDCGFSSIILVNDSQTVTKALRCEDESFSTCSYLAAKAKFLIETFSKVIFSHTRKQGNFVTYNLAKHVSGISVWMEDISPHLLSVTLADFGKVLLVIYCSFRLKNSNVRDVGSS